MANGKKEEDPAPKSGQLIREPPSPVAARTGQQRTVDWLLSKITFSTTSSMGRRQRRLQMHSWSNMRGAIYECEV